MAKIKVHAGDFSKINAQYTFGSFVLNEPGKWTSTSYSSNDIEVLEQASEENVKRLAGTAGWGVAGAALLGPVGLLAGLIGGGRGKDVTFVVKFSDGKKLLGTVDSKAYTKMQASLF
ncbi:hypothetical protein QWY79_10190 [Halomonas sabkhae]|uniref:hypothetical protein n=1 Tax=Halomonas sabkhae TaxID=626223 RepID=UPI0025B3455F|nr:hypothetical protein [Halomonas sabkhae]MDN3525633.1 hypothetical protein [Halomonas sabkhae]